MLGFDALGRLALGEVPASTPAPPRPPSSNIYTNGALPIAAEFPISLRTWINKPQITQAAVVARPANNVWDLPLAVKYATDLRTWIKTPQITVQAQVQPISN